MNFSSASLLNGPAVYSLPWTVSDRDAGFVRMVSTSRAVMVPLVSELQVLSATETTSLCCVWIDLWTSCRHTGSWTGSLSSQVTLLRNWTRSRLKTDWLRGRYSSVASADELLGRKMAPLDAQTWGEILEAELDRWWYLKHLSLILTLIYDFILWVHFNTPQTIVYIFYVFEWEIMMKWWKHQCL